MAFLPMPNYLIVSKKSCHAEVCRAATVRAFTLYCLSLFFSVAADAEDSVKTSVINEAPLVELEDDYDPNIAPTIAGTPAPVAYVGKAYNFLPLARDADKDKLRFSITNLPEWALFNVATGQLSGTPREHDSMQRGIRIEVTDGLDTVSLDSFDLPVLRNETSDTTTIEGAAETSEEVSAPLEFRLPANAPAGTEVGRLMPAGASGESIRFSLVDQHEYFSLTEQGMLVLSKTVNHNKIQRFDLRALQSANNLQSVVPITVVLGAGNGLWKQTWHELPGNSVTALTQDTRYPIAPTETELIAEPILSQESVADTGHRLISYLKPRHSGQYQFSVVGIDNENSDAEIRISSDHLAVNARTIKHTLQLTSKSDAPQIETEFVTLLAGQVYYLEVLLKQSVSALPVAVNWKLDSAQQFKPVPATELYLDGLSLGLVKPEFHPIRGDVLIDSASAVGDIVARTPAVDLQGDELQYSLVESAYPFAIDQSGHVRVSGALAPGMLYPLTIRVNDGTHSASMSLNLSTTVENAVDIALRRGDSSVTGIQPLVNEVNKVVRKHFVLIDDIRNAVFGFASDGSKTQASLNAINWDPSERSIIYESRSATGMVPLLVSNAAVKESESNNEILAMAGVSSHGGRRALLGSNALHDMSLSSYPRGSGNEQMNSFLRNLIAWLVDNPAAESETLNIVVAHQADSYYFKHDTSTASWLTLNFPRARINPQDTCDGAALSACLQHADLLIVGQDNGLNDNRGAGFNLMSTMNEIQSAHEAGLPVLFLPYGGNLTELGSALIDYFDVGVGDNFWRQERLLAYNPHAQRTAFDDPLLALPRTLQFLTTSRAGFVYDRHSCSTQKGHVHCAPDLVTDSQGDSLQQLVLTGIGSVSRTIAELDGAAKSVFDRGEDYRLEKLALLIADQFRQDVRYPMDKHLTDATRFSRALFADGVVSYMRSAKVAPGSDVEGGITRSVTVTPSVQGDWINTGLYAEPGTTIKVTRSGAADYRLALKFNRLRSAPRIWNEQGYDRARSRISTEIALSADKSHFLSAPEGGVIYLRANPQLNHIQSSTVRFENVLSSPRLLGNQTADIQVFSRELATSSSDWVEIETPYVHLHSSRRLFEQAMAGQDGDISNGYNLRDIQHYYKHVGRELVGSKLALTGLELSALPGLQSQLLLFCRRAGLTSIFYEGRNRNMCTDVSIHRKPDIQHVSADDTDFCAGACAPNTIYTARPITPNDAELHRELNRQFLSRRLLLQGKASIDAFSDVLTFYSNWHPIHRHIAQDTPAELLSDIQLVAAWSQDRYAAVTEVSADSHRRIIQLTEDSSEINRTRQIQLAFYLQLIESLNGHPFLSQLFVLDRIFNHAIMSEQRWSKVKDALGFGLFTRQQAYTLRGGDFIYVLSSLYTGKDYHSFFTAWGGTVSPLAREQVVANGASKSLPSELNFAPLHSLTDAIHKLSPLHNPSPADLSLTDHSHKAIQLSSQ